jgi:gentisate 1,2-dioxygenase
MDDYKVDFDASAAAFFSPPGASPKNDPWTPVIITCEEIDAEIERLACGSMPAAGCRESLIVHPRALAGTPGLAPGIQVTLSVLKPGERTTPFRHNATDIAFCIRGRGRAQIGAREVAFGRYDVWNSPSYAVQHRANEGDELLVCLHYSNAPLLRFMQVYIREEAPDAEAGPGAREESADDAARKSPFGVFEIGADGATLMPYEILINPPVVESNALHWPWDRVSAELKKLEGLGKTYVGRRLYLLYNPMTGRTNGTTPNFFATITIRPPGIVDHPHRHVSAAINYYFQGSGRSSVAGNVYRWKAGDLMLSAPGWTVHNHASDDESVYELTVQDQPLNIAMESLLWQENMHRPPALLGAQPGFTTNRRD